MKEMDARESDLMASGVERKERSFTGSAGIREREEREGASDPHW